MGTLSKRPLRDFGVDIHGPVEDVRPYVSGKVDRPRAPVPATSHSATLLVLVGALLGSLATLLVSGLFARSPRFR